MSHNSPSAPSAKQQAQLCHRIAGELIDSLECETLSPNEERLTIELLSCANAMAGRFEEMELEMGETYDMDGVLRVLNLEFQN